MSGAGRVNTFVGDGENGTIAGATYTQSLAVAGLTGIDLDDGTVTDAKLADMPTGTIKGRSAAGSGPPSNISITAFRAMLGLTVADLTGLGEAVADLVATSFGDSPTVAFDYDDEAGTISASIPDGSLTSAKLAFVPATKTYIDAHINDVTDAHDASAISVAPFGGLTAANVQGALMEILAAIGPGGIASGAVPTRVAEGVTYVVPPDTQVSAALPIRVDGTIRIDGTLVIPCSAGGSSTPRYRVPTRIPPGARWILGADDQAVAAVPIRVEGTARIDGTAIFINT